MNPEASILILEKKIKALVEYFSSNNFNNDKEIYFKI